MEEGRWKRVRDMVVGWGALILVVAVLKPLYLSEGIELTIDDHPLPPVRLAQPPQGAHGKGSPGHETRTTCRRHGGVIEIVAE